jgi:hypothetical protein
LITISVYSHYSLVSGIVLSQWETEGLWLTIDTAPKAKHSKMVTLVNYRLKVTLSVITTGPPLTNNKADSGRNDGRALVGQMLAYDKHMNFVLAECEEFRTVKVGSDVPSKSNWAPLRHCSFLPCFWRV